MSWWVMLLLGWAVAAGLMAVLWAIQLRTGSATAVDAGWALCLLMIAVLYGALGGGTLEHRLVIAIPAVLESARIGRLVISRIPAGEDGRYRELRARWRARGREQRSFLVFYQAQGALAAVLSAPLLAASFNRSAEVSPLEWGGLAVWVLGASFEAVADRQLARHRAGGGNRGRTFRGGLWRYSRHPNYFGQWLTWVGYALISLAAPYGWIGLVSPALMLFLILRVTGVPPAEEQALRSRGDDYRRYQRETSAFVPWFPRERPA